MASNIPTIMENAFEYARPVSGKKYVARDNDVRALCDLLRQGEHVALMMTPKSGCTSIINAALLRLRTEEADFDTVEMNLSDIRTPADFLRRLGNSVCRGAASSAREYEEIVGHHLEGSRFFFDKERLRNAGSIISISGEPDRDDTLTMLRFPFSVAAQRGRRMIVVLDDFQNLDIADGGDFLLKNLSSVLGETAKERKKDNCTYVMCGSRINAMKDIFEEKKLFFRTVKTYYPLQPDENEIVAYVNRCLRLSGKVSDNGLLTGVCRLFNGNLWYINHFMSICDHLSMGYIMQPVLKDALSRMIAIHELRFRTMVDSLTSFQLSFLKAALDGHTRFSSSEVISSYGLHSSANAKRLREALLKKEIITFNDKDEPVFEDPLFEYWIKKYFFKMNVEF